MDAPKDAYSHLLIEEKPDVVTLTASREGTLVDAAREALLYARENAGKKVELTTQPRPQHSPYGRGGVKPVAPMTIDVSEFLTGNQQANSTDLIKAIHDRNSTTRPVSVSGR